MTDPMDAVITDADERDPARRRVRLLNAWIDDLTCGELLQRLEAGGGTVFTLNLDHLYLLQRDRDFQAAYAGADFVTADSHYVHKALGWLGRGIREKISGSDLAPRYCQHHRTDKHVRVFLLGAGDGVAERARERINARAGHEVVVGAHAPSMRIADDAAEIAAVAELVSAARATTLIVGLGSPKQEVWLHRHRHLMPGVRVFMGVGASLEYEAGTLQRAPRWMQSTGLEWLHRAVTKPGRYAQRYLRDLEFFWLLLLDATGRYKAPPPASPR